MLTGVKAKTQTLCSTLSEPPSSRTLNGWWVASSFTSISCTFSSTIPQCNFPLSPPENMDRSYNEKDDSLTPSRTASTTESAVKFDSHLAARDESSPLSRKCSLLLETPTGAEYRSEKQDESSASSTTSLSSDAISTSRIAGPRFAIAKWLRIDRWQQQLAVVGCFML